MPTSTFMDISLLVADTDYYHLECQMKNEREMVIRMFAYDVRFAITHTRAMDENTGEIILYFPRSVVIYPEQNNAIPKHFIPYTILRLRPNITPNIVHKLTHNELTEFVEKAILVLKEELSDGYLTELEFRDYVRLFQMAADRVLARHPRLREEVYQMTEPLIKLPSMIENELRTKLRAEIAEQKAEIRRLQELVNQLAAGNSIS